MSPPAHATISIIIGAYNRQRYIRAAIGSVLNQTRRDFELLVWDDGSSDGTGDIAREIAGGDDRVRVMSAPNQGYPAVLNAAAGHLTGKYLGWVDSDDALAPTALEETAAALDAHPDIGMVYTNYRTMDEEGLVRGVGKRCSVPYSRDRLLTDFMTFHFRLMRRSLFNAVGGIDEAMAFAEDYDLCLKLSEITEIHHLERPLYFYRVHEQTISHESRLKQITASGEAIRRALKRRGLENELELKVEIIGQYQLRKKGHVSPPSER